MKPNEVATARLQIAISYLGETNEYLAKDDPIQACEKLYKVTEECVKILAVRYSI